jgi:hypothetical protein
VNVKTIAAAISTGKQILRFITRPPHGISEQETTSRREQSRGPHCAPLQALFVHSKMPANNTLSKRPSLSLSALPEQRTPEDKHHAAKHGKSCKNEPTPSEQFPDDVRLRQPEQVCRHPQPSPAADPGRTRERRLEK